jgi:putative Mg2+ transporter-C (MgtC) family protein
MAMLSHSEMILRMAAGAAFGGVIGYERDRHGRPVGLRTHVLVALSSATFMIVSSQFAYYQHFEHATGIDVDASRIAASVVSAIGFLAGGSILRTGTTLAGLTTAAGLWLITAIGLCAGAGMYIESAIATLFGVLALTSLRRFEDKDDRFTKRRLLLEITPEAGETADRICAAIVGLGGTVIENEYDRQFGAAQYAHWTVDVRLPVQVSVRQLVAALETQHGLARVRIQSLH